MTLKSILKGVSASACALILTASAAIAQWEPPKPIKFYISFGVGGPLDTVARVVAAELENQTGWQVIPESRAGGGGVALATQLAHGSTDGTAIGMLVNMPILINLVRKGDELPFNLDSFTYLGSAATAEKGIIALADAPFSTIPELIEYAKANDIVMGAAPGPELFVYNALNNEADGNIRKLATEGSKEALTFILGGQADVGFGAGTHFPYLDSGEIKVIASINSERLTYAPATPTLVEEGINLSIDPFFYIIAPKGLDTEAANALTQAIAGAVDSDAVRDVVNKLFQRDPTNYGPEGTRARLEEGLVTVRNIFGK